MPIAIGKTSKEKAEYLEEIMFKILSSEISSYTASGITVTKHNIQVLEKMIDKYKTDAIRERSGFNYRIV